MTAVVVVVVAAVVVMIFSRTFRQWRASSPSLAVSIAMVVVVAIAVCVHSCCKVTCTPANGIAMR